MNIAYKKANKKIVYVDMENVLADFSSTPGILEEFSDCKDELVDVFNRTKPIKGAVQGFNVLGRHYDIYIFAATPWDNPSAWSAILAWLKTHFGAAVHNRIILSHNKHLNIGDYLIDARTINGADKFMGEHIHFGTKNFPDWRSVLEYLGCDLPPPLMTEIEIKTLLNKYQDVELFKIPRDKMTPEQYKAHTIKIYRATSSHCIMPASIDEDSKELPREINRNRNSLPVKPRREDFDTNDIYREQLKIYRRELSWYKVYRIKECDYEAFFNEFKADQIAQKRRNK